MNTITFDSIIKKSVLELNAFEKVSSLEILVGLGIALLISAFIFWVYKATFKGTVYNYTYNVSLVMMCLLTTMVIMTISTNIVLSLGMVGALSIVRFRTAIKDPMDIVFMFWAIGVGIATGAGMYPIAVIASLFIALVILIFYKFDAKGNTYIFIVNYEETTARDKVKVQVNKLKHTIKSKTVTGTNVELIIELKLKDDNTAFVNNIAAIEGVKNAVLMTYSGEYAS